VARLVGISAARCAESLAWALISNLFDPKNANPAQTDRSTFAGRYANTLTLITPMKLLDALVEQRISAAAARGEFDNLPGAGAPLEFDDDLLVPEEVRVANRIMKNAGFVPPAVEHLRALRDLQCDIGKTEDPAVRGRLQARMLALDMALESLRGGGSVVPLEYRRRIAARLSERERQADTSS
jgi:hypothetical protein